jgi:hypothetical protein
MFHPGNDGLDADTDRSHSNRLIDSVIDVLLALNTAAFLDRAADSNGERDRDEATDG